MTEAVNHPRHYGGHPSGVETIELVRLLSFDLGNAVKYVMRRDDKGTAKQDLQKALWYIKDEVAHLCETAVVTEPALAMTLTRRIELSETNEHAKAFYHGVAGFLNYQHYTSPPKKYLTDMAEAVEALLKTYD